jgi:hypothetical protein
MSEVWPYLALAGGVVGLGFGWVGVGVLVGFAVLACIGWVLHWLAGIGWPKEERAERRGSVVVQGRQPRVGDKLFINGEYVGEVVGVERADATPLNKGDWEELRRLGRAGWN